VGGMQGRLIFAIILSALPSTAAMAGEPQRRQGCPRGEQVQQRQQPAQQQVQQRRNKPQGCPIIRSIPAVVDQTPMFIL
jgi:hypothetical protein